MKHIYSGLFALIMGIVIALPAVAPAQADSGNTIPAVTIPALMIKVNNPVEVGQPITITVFSRHSNETIAGAPVYAIKTSGRVGSADPGNYTTLTDDFEALLESNGTLIGTTGSDGRLSGVLVETGRYLLIATKDGFIPGLARLQVKQVTEGGQKLRLNLQAPASSPIGQQVTIKVTYGISGEAVENATVSAFKTANRMPPIIKPAPVPTENGTATQMIIGQQSSIMIDAEREDALAGRLGKREIILGSSNNTGEVSYIFNDPGTFMLLVRKDGYLPGTGRINIQADTALKPLDIVVVFNTISSQPASIQVTEKNSGQPVAEVAVYALKVENTKDVKQMPPKANNGKAMANWVLNDADRVREKGALVGNTDSAGQVSYSFPSPGQYMLAAFKDGYATAVIRTSNIQPISGKALVLKAPAEANAGESINVTVYDDNGAAVNRAAVYSVRLDSVKEGPSLLKLLPSLTADVKRNYMSLLRNKSSLSGYTDENGQVAVTFAGPGIFLLLAVKDGFIPDFARINILQVPTVTTVPVPQSTTTTTTTTVQ